MLKRQHNAGKESHFYFWRDQKGHEVDLIEDRATELFPIEIKLSQTFNPDFIKNIKFFNKLQGSETGQIIYNGSEYNFNNVQVLNWKDTL